MGKYKFDFSSLLSGIDKNTVGLKDMVKLIDGLSLNQVVGNNNEAPFSSKATTYLYSGGVTIGDISISAGDIENAFENARTLDQTVAANFLYLKYLMLVSNFFGLNIRYFNYSWHLKYLPHRHPTGLYILHKALHT